ncbi:hypothetical protein D9M72_321310 [compost metagenome]
MHAAGAAIGGRIHGARRIVEAPDCRLQARGPVVALVQHQEIVAAHMAEKIACGITGLGQDGGRALEHLIALPVAILVVERLEMVQVDIAGAELAGGFDQSLDMLVQRNIAGQEGQRIGVARRLHAHFGDGPDQVGAGAQADIAALFGDHETIGKRTRVLAGQDLRHLLQAGAMVKAGRLAVGHGDAGLLAIQLAMERRRVAVDKGLAADDRQRPAFVIDDGHGLQVGLVLEDTQHRIVAGGRGYGRRWPQQAPGGNARPA